MSLGLRATVRRVAVVATVFGLVAVSEVAPSGAQDGWQQPGVGIVVQQAQMPDPPTMVFPIKPYPCGTKKLEGRECVRYNGLIGFQWGVTVANRSQLGFPA